MRSHTPGRYVRTFSVNFNQWQERNFDGDLLSLGGNVNMHWTFQNLWSTGFGVNVNRRGFDDRLTRGGPGGYRVGNVNSWQYMNTSTRLPVSLHWSSNFNVAGDGTRDVSVTPTIQFRPTSSLSGQLGLRFSRNENDAQWVRRVEQDGGDRYVFGRLSQVTTSLTARLSYTITPNLSLQLYGQPFLSAGEYGGYSELVDGLALEHDDRYAPFGYDGRADFNVLSFRTTNVLRWEFQPGSAIFVVWQQSREDEREDGNFQFGRDYGRLFSTPSRNTLLVKVAHWLNF